MGCSGVPINTYQKNYNLNNELNQWKNIKFEIINSIRQILLNKHLNDIKIGIFDEKEYKKGKKWKVVNKNVKRKFFILFEKHINKKESIHQDLNNYFEKNPIFQKYNNTINTDFFSPMKIMNDDFSELIPKKYKEQISNKLFIFTFTNSLNNEIDKLNEIKKQHPDNYDFKEIKGNDKFFYLNGYTLFFHKDKLLYWINNEYLFPNNFNTLLEGKKETNIEQYKKYIKNYLSNNNTENKEFYIKFTNITLYNSNGNIILNEIFPLIIQSLNELQEENEDKLNLIKSIVPNININDIIKQFYKKIDDSIRINDIETFKEKKFSFLTQSLFTYQKKMIIKLSPISSEILEKILNKTEKELNPILNKINPQYSINHIVIVPSKNENFTLLNNTKKVILLFRFSKCLEYIYDFLKEKYSIFNEITYICLYNNKSIHKIDNDLKNKITFLDENNIKGEINCYFKSLYSNSYNSHLLIILDNNTKISFCDFFKNSASIYCDYLKSKKENISTPLENINKSIFKEEIKNEFIKMEKENISDSLLQKLKNKKSINISSIFKIFYDENIFYQPYISLKYNITLKKNIKNYTINMIYFKEENIDKNFPLKNELCKSFSNNDSYCKINEFIRCKICNDILFGQITNEGILENNIYSFYICPITNNIFCKNCYNSNKKEIISNPFNLLYVKCNDKRLYMNIPYNNIYYFRNCDDIQNYPEVIDNLCDICIKNIYSENSKYFYLLVNFINRNLPFLVCEKCFEILTDSQQNKILFYENKMLFEILKNNFIDINNLIFKIIKIKDN